MVDSAEKYFQHRFPGQKEGEQIQALIRKHWIIDIKIGSMFFMIGVLPFMAAFALMIVFWDGTFNDNFLYAALGLWVYLLGVLGFTYMSWLNEELDVIIVTNERVVSHDQIDLFHRQISETNIAQVQDVKGVEKGVLGNMLHYGMLEIQTAARDITFTIKHVNLPYESARQILDVRDKYMDKEKFETRPGWSGSPGTGAPKSSSPVFNI